jgi:uncharacterized protein YjiS (DUF1127 family)
MAYMNSAAAASATHPPSWPYLLADLREAFVTYRRKRAIYERTFRELQSYSRRDLLELGISPDQIDELARRQAGW